jgi:5-formyltetrahydrofolate cyclo-ligase
MKQRRRELAPTQIRDASAQVSRQLWRLPAMQRARRIAIYMSVAGEIDCDQIVKTAWLRKIETFAPILMGKRLIFAPLKKHTRTTPNRYHIPEPTHSRRQCIKSSQLDVVIVPVLAFDKDNNRLGMGGGFYDRSFAYMKHRQKLQRPLLIGVAYDFQRVPKLQAEPWDVQLHAVITDKESYGSH